MSVIESVGEFRWKHRHSTVSGAYESGGLNGARMGLRHASAFQQAGDKCRGEGVARTDGIGHLHHGSGLKRHIARGEDIAAVDATGENEHFKIVFSKQNPAFVLEVYAGIAKHAAHRDQFLIIDFKNIAALHGIA